MSAHPAPRATRSIRAETAGLSGLALGPNQRGKAGGEVEASIPVMAMARQRTRRRVRRRTHPPRRGSIVPAEREATQTQLEALDHATAPGNDTALLDLIPLLTDTIALHPEHTQAALHQAFDIQALYKDDMNQVTFFATITTSTPQAVAAILNDIGHDPSTTGDPQPPAAATAS